jgi:hypothetical protein
VIKLPQRQASEAAENGLAHVQKQKSKQSNKQL